MNRLLVGIGIGMLVTCPTSEALRFARPPEFHEWNTNTFTQLNDTLLQIYNLANGRYTLDYITVTPNGARNGQRGDLVYAVFGGTNYLCVNISSTNPGTTWKCAALS